MIAPLLREDPQPLSTLPACSQQFDEQGRRFLWIVQQRAAVSSSLSAFSSG